MFLLLNISNVIIDIVSSPRYVRVNENNGKKVQCFPYEAQGIIGSDNDTIYPLTNKQLISTYYDIQTVVTVEDVPTEVRALAYKYENGEFLENEEPYPESNKNLTVGVNTNATTIEDTQVALCEVFEMIENLQA